VLKYLCGAAFALLPAAESLAQDSVVWQENIQGWSVAVDRTIDNSCYIVSGFEDDVFLRFQFNATRDNVQFIVANINWESLKSGGNYDVAVAFGDLDAWAGTAKGHRWNDILPSLVLSVPIEDQQASHFMRQFAETDTVKVSHGGSEIANLDLNGVEEAVASMLNCQSAMSESEKAKSSGRDPFALAPDPI
jgi:hypothetical protein